MMTRREVFISQNFTTSAPETFIIDAAEFAPVKRFSGHLRCPVSVASIEHAGYFVLSRTKSCVVSPAREPIVVYVGTVTTVRFENRASG